MEGHPHTITTHTDITTSTKRNTGCRDYTTSIIVVHTIILTMSTTLPLSLAMEALKPLPVSQVVIHLCSFRFPARTPTKCTATSQLQRARLLTSYGIHLPNTTK